MQEFERAIDPRLRPAESMADAYCEQIHVRCRAAEGQVFVAESGGAVAGFVAVLAREPFTDLDDPPGKYALITDVVVLPEHRGQGVGRRLLERAEAFGRPVRGSFASRCWRRTRRRGGCILGRSLCPTRRCFRSAGSIPHDEFSN